jgi:hypothetical protein
MTPEKTLKQATVDELIAELAGRSSFLCVFVKLRGDCDPSTSIRVSPGFGVEAVGAVALMQRNLMANMEQPQVARPSPRTN